MVYSFLCKECRKDVTRRRKPRLYLCDPCQNKGRCQKSYTSQGWLHGVAGGWLQFQAVQVGPSTVQVTGTGPSTRPSAVQESGSSIFQKYQNKYSQSLSFPRPVQVHDIHVILRCNGINHFYHHKYT